MTAVSAAAASVPSDDEIAVHTLSAKAAKQLKAGAQTASFAAMARAMLKRAPYHTEASGGKSVISSVELCLVFNALSDNPTKFTPNNSSSATTRSTTC
jgi:hypothetical protein